MNAWERITQGGSPAWRKTVEATTGSPWTCPRTAIVRACADRAVYEIFSGGDLYYSGNAFSVRAAKLAATNLIK